MADDTLVAHVRRRRTRAPVWDGPLRFPSFVGDFALDVVLEGRRHLSLRLEVFPGKLNYLEDHRALIDDVAKYERSLPFAIVAPTTVAHDIAVDELLERTRPEWLAMIRHEEKNLRESLRAIAARPHEQL